MTTIAENKTIARLSYSDYCKDFIRNSIEGHEGQTHYACNLASEITMGINMNGSATYSTYEAKEYLREWWDECADYWQYEKDNFGEVLHNPFECPESFHMCMIIQGVSSLLAQCKVIDAKWNDQIKITKKVIKSILSEIEDLEVQL